MKKVGKEPLISVIVPVYNVEKYVGKCLNSITNQSYKNLEIIVVDDGSTDHSSSICKDYAKKDKRIKIVRQKNGGLASARNTGLKNTKSGYITFVDSDDWIEKNYISTLYNGISENNADISIVRFFVDYANVACNESTGAKLKLTPKECIERMLYDDGINVMAWGKLYRKKLFNDIKYPNGKNFEDVATTYKLVLKSKLIFSNSTPLYHYQKIDQTSITNTKFNPKKMDLIWATERFTNGVIKKYPDLKAACNARMMDAYIRTLTETLKGGADRQTTCNLLTYIKQNRKIVIKDTHLTKRNRLMVMATSLGYKPFKIFRYAYELVTGKRNVYTSKH